MSEYTVTAPWAAEAETLVRGALRHEYEVSIHAESAGLPDPLPLTVLSCTLTYDEFWSPYVQGELVAQIPDADTLAQLDPRLLIRVEVKAGYLLPGAVRDVHPMAVAYLSARSMDYPANELRLSFQGPEYVIDRAEADTDAETHWTTATAPSVAVRQCLEAAGYTVMEVTGWEPEEYIDFYKTWLDPAQPWDSKAGDNWLSMARDIADRIDAWFRCDPDGVFRLSNRDWGYSDTYHQLRHGADGTIITAGDAMSRDGWANKVQVHYSWSVLTTTDGVSTATPKEAIGGAELSGTPYDPGLVGEVFARSSRPWPSTRTLAGQAAASLLRRYSVRANALSVSAVAAYWLRPAQGITVELPAGGQQDLVVSAVTFDLGQGRMDIRTRNPEPGDVSQIG